jgi:hypothetical protein
MATAPGGDTAPGKLAGRPGPCAGEERRVSVQRPARAEATTLLRCCVVGLLNPRLDVPRQRARHGDRHALRGGPGARGSGAGGVAPVTSDLSLRRFVAEALALPFATALTYTLSPNRARAVLFEAVTREVGLQATQTSPAWSASRSMARSPPSPPGA